MKKLSSIIAVAVMVFCVCVSCDNEVRIGTMEDLVGTYNVELTEDVVWGGSSSTVRDNGKIVVTKLNLNK